MRHSLWILGLLAWLAVWAAPAAATQDEKAEKAGTTAGQAAPDIAPEAAAPMQAMCGLLKSRPSFAFTAEVDVDHVYPNGQTVQIARIVDVVLKRPDKLYARVTGDDRDRVFVYDGKTMTVADFDRGVYAVVDAPPTIDQTLDLLAAKYGVVAPQSDILYSDPCARMLRGVRTGDCVGSHLAAGKTCDHLVFAEKDADWQLWVEKDKTPLPRKLVITDKEIMGWPQYGVVFTKWDLNPRLPADLFTFTPQPDARRIDFLPLVTDQGQTK